MLAVYLVCVAGLVGLVIVISQPLTSDLQRLANDFLTAYENIRDTWPKASLVQQIIASQLPVAGDVITQVAGSQPAVLAQTVLGVTLSAFDFVAQVVLILVLSVYWSADQVRFERLWLSLLKAEDRMRARTIWRSVEHGMGSYIGSEVIQSLLAVLVLSAANTVIGLHYPVLVAVISAVLWFIPLVGGLIVVLTVIAFGLMSSPLVALVAVVITVAVLATLEYVVEPRLFDRKSYNPILVLVVMIAMTDAFGLLGLIVAPAVAVALQICIAELTNSSTAVSTGLSSEAVTPPPVQSVPQVDQIRDRLATVKWMLSQQNEPSPRLLSMTERLEGLVEELDPVGEKEQFK
jgi:predicted PurR-regulated permease PerM